MTVDQILILKPMLGVDYKSSREVKQAFNDNEPFRDSSGGCCRKSDLWIFDAVFVILRYNRLESITTVYLKSS